MNSFPPHRRQSAGSSSPSPAFRRCKVILLNTVGMELGSIIHIVMELTHYAKAEATHRMWEAIHFGRSLVLVTHLERAELYQEQFQERGLAVALEPA